MRIPPELIDLSAPGCREQIAGREDPARWQFPDLNELWLGRPHHPWWARATDKTPPPF